MQRVAANGGRPVRVLYINDLDPRGHGMALAVARKLGFMIARDSPSTGLQVRQIVLTKEQVERLNLPRNEIKKATTARRRLKRTTARARPNSTP